VSRFSHEQLVEIIRRQGYAIGQCSFGPATVAPQVSDPVAQHAAGPEPLEADAPQEGCRPRVGVRITRCGTQLLDKDNLYGSTKYLCDALRYKGLIPEDDPESIHLTVKQRKVSKKETGTLIEIYPIT